MLPDLSIEGNHIPTVARKVTVTSDSHFVHSTTVARKVTVTSDSHFVHSLGAREPCLKILVSIRRCGPGHRLNSRNPHRRRLVRGQRAAENVAVTS
jgi:hypothetical protein